MSANTGGTVEVILNLVFSDLTKDLSFSYILALPSSFNCMNEGHLKWFGFETKGLWGRGTGHNVCLSLCLHLLSLSLLIPLFFPRLLFSHICDDASSSHSDSIKISVVSSRSLQTRACFCSPWGSSTSPLNSSFFFFFTHTRSSSCDLNTTPAKINFSAEGREIVEMEQPAGFFQHIWWLSHFLDSNTMLVPVTQNSDESSTLLVKSPCFCQVVFLIGRALCALHYVRATLTYLTNICLTIKRSRWF